jgi:predicted Zn-dependent protease
MVAPAGLRAHGTFHDRLIHLQTEINAAPGDALLHCRMAELRCEHGDFTEALAAVARAEQIDPAFALLDLVRGDIYLQGGRLPEARAALDRYLEKSPKNARALLLRARTKVAATERKEALVDYRAALSETASPEPDLIQEVSDALAAQGMAEEALAVLDSGLCTLGAIPSLTLRAMDLEVATGRYDAALARVDALQKSAPRPEPWMAKRAGLLAQANRKDDARAAWTALAKHLAALPNLERGSHAMSLLAEQARQALAAL